MAKFPVDAPRDRVIRAFGLLGFRMVRDGNHISLSHDNADGTSTPLTMPNHRTLKSSTLRTILTQIQVTRDEFLEAYDNA